MSLGVEVAPVEISHKLFFKPFSKSQFLHEPVNSLFILVIVKDKLTNLLGG